MVKLHHFWNLSQFVIHDINFFNNDEDSDRISSSDGSFYVMKHTQAKDGFGDGSFYVITLFCYDSILFFSTLKFPLPMLLFPFILFSTTLEHLFYSFIFKL